MFFCSFALRAAFGSRQPARSFCEFSDGRLAARRIAATEMSALLVVGTALSKPITPATRQLPQILKGQVAEFVAQKLARGNGPGVQLISQPGGAH